MRKPVTTCAIIVISAIVAASLVVSVRTRTQTSSLYVHVEGLDWTNITVQSENLARPQQFDRSVSEVRVSPISHGVYRIGVRLATGQVLWSELFHSDVGVRHRLDVFLSALVHAGYIHFRQTTNQKELLFESNAGLSDLSEEKPFRLDWI